MKANFLTASLASITAAALLATINVNANTNVSALQLSHIQKMNARCLEHAREAKHEIAIAIYDQSGILLSYMQTDDASPGAGEVARWKGLSSAFYRTATAKTAEWNVPNAPKIATIQGGLPIFSADGKPLGGIGISGAPAEFDEQCAALATQAAGMRN